MSKPGKVLKGLCKKLGVRLTVKRGKKRVYKSIKVLKKQCANKKKKRKKVKRKFGKLLLKNEPHNKWKAVLLEDKCEICNQDEKDEDWCRFDTKKECKSVLEEYKYKRPFEDYTEGLKKLGVRGISEQYNFSNDGIKDVLFDFLAPTEQMVSERKRRTMTELTYIPSLEHVFNPRSEYNLLSNTDLVPGNSYRFILLSPGGADGRASGLEGLKPRVKTGKYINYTGVGRLSILFDGEQRPEIIPPYT